MPLQLLPLEESELKSYDGIASAAFKDDLFGLLYPNGRPQEAQDQSVASGLKQWRRYPNKIKMMKVIDTDLPDSGPFGKIVGVSKWCFYPQDRSEAELKAEDDESKEDPDPPGVNVALRTEFFGNIRRIKREVIGGKAYVMLQLLATLPDHHRRGIGAMHLKWGAEKADELGLPSYLEASPAGRPLYERVGFEKVRDFPFDARKWGANKDMPHVCMLRPAMAANGSMS